MITFTITTVASFKTAQQFEEFLEKYADVHSKYLEEAWGNDIPVSHADRTPFGVVATTYTVVDDAPQVAEVKPINGERPMLMPEFGMVVRLVIRRGSEADHRMRQQVGTLVRNIPIQSEAGQNTRATGFVHFIEYDGEAAIYEIRPVAV